MSAKESHWDRRVDVPESRHIIVAVSYELVTVGNYCNSIDSSIVAFELANQITIDNIP